MNTCKDCIYFVQKKEISYCDLVTGKGQTLGCSEACDAFLEAEE